MKTEYCMNHSKFQVVMFPPTKSASTSYRHS